MQDHECVGGRYGETCGRRDRAVVRKRAAETFAAFLLSLIAERELNEQPFGYETSAVPVTSSQDVILRRNLSQGVTARSACFGSSATKCHTGGRSDLREFATLRRLTYGGYPHRLECILGVTPILLTRRRATACSMNLIP